MWLLTLPFSLGIQDDDGNWLDDSLNLFEEEPLYREFMYRLFDEGSGTKPILITVCSPVFFMPHS